MILSTSGRRFQSNSINHNINKNQEIQFYDLTYYFRIWQTISSLAFHFSQYFSPPTFVTFPQNSSFFFYLCPLFDDFYIFTDILHPDRMLILLSIYPNPTSSSRPPLKQVITGHCFWKTSSQQKCLPFLNSHSSLLGYHFNELRTLLLIEVFVFA